VLLCLLSVSGGIGRGLNVWQTEHVDNVLLLFLLSLLLEYCKSLKNGCGSSSWHTSSYPLLMTLPEKKRKAIGKNMEMVEGESIREQRNVEVKNKEGLEGKRCRRMQLCLMISWGS